MACRVQALRAMWGHALHTPARRRCTEATPQHTCRSPRARSLRMLRLRTADPLLPAPLAPVLAHARARPSMRPRYIHSSQPALPVLARVRTAATQPPHAHGAGRTRPAQPLTTTDQGVPPAHTACARAWANCTAAIARSLTAAATLPRGTCHNQANARCGAIAQARPRACQVNALRSPPPPSRATSLDAREPTPRVTVGNTRANDAVGEFALRVAALSAAGVEVRQ
jgi:hypothetical protein